VLRRLLWLLPTLFLVSLLTFQLLAWTLPHQVSRDSSELPQQQPAPVFFNPDPQNAKDLALSLMDRVAKGGAESEAAARMLVRLGGAALPHILPRLDELGPVQRARVSVALKPIALRMGVGSEAELSDPESASLFWTRFWQDRQFDFRPVVVRRLVSRLSERALALRRDDVVQLDTYALSELVRALGRINDAADIARVQRLSALLSHITGKQEWRFATADLGTARRNARTWRSWWLAHGEHYVTLDGIARVTASLSQTRYGRWVQSVPLGLGTRPDGSTVWGTLNTHFAPTLTLLLFGSLGGYLVGAALGVLAAARSFRLHHLDIALALLGASAPILFAWGHATGQESQGLALGSLLMLCFGAGVAYLYQKPSSRTRRVTAWWPRAPFGPLTGVSLLQHCATSWLGLLSSGLPTLFLAAAVLEHVLSLPGLARISVAAVHDADHTWLMAMALVGTTLAAVLQLASDTLARHLEPREARSSAGRFAARPG
jgi:ABC-type dipeptide/oligopeptide/nickel transport system permease component